MRTSNGVIRTMNGQSASQERKRRNKLSRQVRFAAEAASLGISSGELLQRHERERLQIISQQRELTLAANRRAAERRSSGYYW